MPIVLEQEQLTVAAKRLQGRDNTEYILGELRAYLDNVITDYDFMVDQWPDFRAIVGIVSPMCAKHPVYLRTLYCVFSEDIDALLKVLRQSGVLNTTTFTNLLFVDEVTKEGLINGLEHLHQGSYQLNIYRLMTLTSTTLNLSPIPDDFTITPLRKDQAALVNSSWAFNQGEHTKPYIEDLIAKLPSCCMYDREGKVVGFALQFHFGHLGMLLVFEQYRRKGYGKVIMSQLAEKCLKKSKKIFVHVGVNNMASLKLHESIGFTQGPLRYVVVFENGLFRKGE